MFELKVIDLPVVNYFPPDNIAEWTDFKYYGLRSASAYILVYDVSLPSTFQFIKTLREQMFETRDMTNIPVLVVANKMDLELSRKSSRFPLTVHSSNYPSYNYSSHPSHKDRDPLHHHNHHRLQSNNHHHSQHGGNSSKTEQSRGDPSGGIGGSGNIAVPVSVTGSSAINVTTCLASDSFHHHSKSSSTSQPTHTISGAMGSKSVPLTAHNGVTTVSKSTKGNHKPSW